jgi:hypothetical protein
VVSFASKLRQVVAANFVEISRPDTSDSKNKPKESAPVADAIAVTSESVETQTPQAESVVMEPASTDTPSVAVVAAEPEPVVEEISSIDPMALVGSDGTIEYDKVYARAEIPAAASFTAEQALSMLHSMPSDLPLRVKRLTVKATLDAVGKAVGATPRDIINDAERKISTLENFIREISERAQAMRDFEDAEIERLRTLIQEKEAGKAVIGQREEDVFRSCRTKINDLDQVIAFFTASENEEAARAVTEPDASETEDNEELPAYLQEDAVKRLLGLSSNPEDTDTENISSEPEAESESAGTRSRGSRTRR